MSQKRNIENIGAQVYMDADLEEAHVTRALRARIDTLEDQIGVLLFFAH